MLKGMLISIALTIAWVMAHIILFRLKRPGNLCAAMVILFVLTVPLFIVVYVLTPADLFILPAALSRTPPALGVGNGLVVHGLLFLTYIACFYYLTRAVTLGILVEILDRGGCAMNIEEMKAAYNIEHMVRYRLEALEQAGLVRKAGGSYLCTPRGRRYARISLLCRRVFGSVDKWGGEG